MQVVSRVDGVWQVTNSRQSVSELIGEENVDIQPFRAKGVDGIAVEYSPTDAAVTFVAPFDEPSPNETDLKTVELHFPALHDLSVVSHANTGLRFNHDQARRDVDNDGDLDLIVSHGSGVAVLFAVGEGDFDRSGRPTISDLTLLRTAIGDPSFEDRGRFDLNRDGLLDSADEEAWIADVARTQSGDTDLDGDVDFRDFLTLARNFGAATTNWSDGDFDGNGEVDIADFVALRGNFGFRRD